MGAERIIDRIPATVFLAERNIHAPKPDAQLILAMPELGDVFEIKVSLAQFYTQVPPSLVARFNSMNP